MTKSSAVLFILIFSLIFKLEELVSPASLVSVADRPPRLWNDLGGDLDVGDH